MLSNISRSKGNEKIRFGRLIEYNKRIIFLQKLCKKWGRETSSWTFFCFYESFIWVKSKWSVACLVSVYFDIVLNLAYNKNKLFKILEYWSRGHARNQKFFRAGEVSWDLGTFINILPKTPEKKRFGSEKFGSFFP